MKSTVLLKELTILGKRYGNIRAGVPTSYPLLPTVDVPTLRLPIFADEDTYIGNLLAVHRRLSPFHVSIASRVFGGVVLGSEDSETIVQELTEAGLISPTGYSYSSTGSKASHLFLTHGALYTHIEEALQGSPHLNSTPTQKA